ncbi:MAG: hypothetical protein WBM43_01470 [Flavobacteriaceae bacterium]
MKVVKELPLYLLHSLKLSTIPKSRLGKQSKETLPIIVSLTSIESRLKSLHLVIRSLLTQSQLPQKIVLWLHQDLKEKLPGSLTKLESDLFEICYTHLRSSHKKLIHSLEKYPESIIVTCDDDLMYRKNWLSLIYAASQDFPGYIIGNETLHVNYSKEGEPLPYRKWKYPENALENDNAIIAIGAWGILYPPHSLNKKVFDTKLFMELAPFSDDFWFKAMALLEQTKTKQASITPKEPIPIAGTQKISLKKMNIKGVKNDVQWKTLSDYFDLLKYIEPR